MAEWFYVKNNKQHGPISTDKLRHLLITRQIPANALTWKKGFLAWEDASTVGDLIKPSAPNVMSGISLYCIHCGQHLEASPDMGGDYIDCPKCNHPIVIPAPIKKVKRPPVLIHRLAPVQTPVKSSKTGVKILLNLIGMFFAGAALQSMFSPFYSAYVSARLGVIIASGLSPMLPALIFIGISSLVVRAVKKQMTVKAFFIAAWILWGGLESVLITGQQAAATRTHREMSATVVKLKEIETIYGRDMTLDLGGGTAMEFVWVEVLNGWVGKYEVTSKEYRCYKPGYGMGSNLSEDRQPAGLIGYIAAVAYASWVNQKFSGLLPAGYQVRLPNGAEWMTFAQCGDGREYPWGNEWPPRYGNYHGQEGTEKWPKIENYNDGYPVSCPVEQSGRNSWGLYGVGGNVSEWTSELDGEVRGASWAFYHESDLRCAKRVHSDPSYRDNDTGFRLVMLR